MNGTRPGADSPRRCLGMPTGVQELPETDKLRVVLFAVRVDPRIGKTQKSSLYPGYENFSVRWCCGVALRGGIAETIVRPLATVPQRNGSKVSPCADRRPSRGRSAL